MSRPKCDSCACKAVALVQFYMADGRLHHGFQSCADCLAGDAERTRAHRRKHHARDLCKQHAKEVPA